MNLNLVDNQNSLSIRIYSDGFSLWVYNEHRQIISQVDTKSKNLLENGDFQQLFSEQQHVHPHYKNISICCETDFYTLIPEGLCKIETMRDFLKLQHPDLPDTTSVLQSPIKTQQSVLIYALNNKLLAVVGKIFNQLQIKHHLKTVIDKLVASNQDMIILWVRKQKVDFIVYKGSSICLLNSYDYKTSEDIVYHALNIYHQCKLDPEKFKITTYSDDMMHLELLLKNYITNAVCKPIQSEHEDYQWEI